MSFSSCDPQQNGGECADLISALHAAEECKEYLQKSQPNEALVCYIKAFAHSVHCVVSLQEGAVPALVGAIEFLENDHKGIFARLGKPLVLQASLLLLIGQRLQDLPCSERAIATLYHDICYNPSYDTLAIQLHLKLQDLHWAFHLGRFKTALRMLTQNGYLQSSDDSCHSCQDCLETSIQQLYHLRPDHPATFEAVSLFQQHCGEHPYQVENAMIEYILSEALDVRPDPAAAMNHLLQTMYIMLMACYGKPSSETKFVLRQIADQWIELFNVLRSRNVNLHGNLWECVADRMHAAMLLLGHTFPLDQCLNGHLFAHIVQDVHLAVRAEFEVPNGQQDSGPSSSEEEDNPQENNEVIVHLDDPPSCPSCKKHLGQAVKKKTRLFPCTSCHSAVYSSLSCQEEHYAHHRGACKGLQLRDKVQKRSSNTRAY